MTSLPPTYTPPVTYALSVTSRETSLTLTRRPLPVKMIPKSCDPLLKEQDSPAHAAPAPDSYHPRPREFVANMGHQPRRILVRVLRRRLRLQVPREFSFQLVVFRVVVNFLFGVALACICLVVGGMIMSTHPACPDKVEVELQFGCAPESMMLRESVVSKGRHEPGLCLAPPTQTAPFAYPHGLKINPIDENEPPERNTTYLTQTVYYQKWIGKVLVYKILGQESRPVLETERVYIYSCKNLSSPGKRHTFKETLYLVEDNMSTSSN